MRRLLNRLKASGCKISVAESCTGGLISKMITDLPGASEVFDLAVTTYSNEMKTKLLGVKPETLAEFGAVSAETAREMAKGVLALAGADIAVAVTGIAGPSNAGSQKPVGTVCIGIATNETCYAATFVFAGNRKQIRQMSAKTALYMVIDELGIGGMRIKKERSVAKKADLAVKKTKKALDKLIKR